MAHHMFGDVVDPSIKVGSRKWYTVPLSIVVHTVILVALVIIPLMAADVLPVPPGMMNAFVAGSPPPPPPPPPPPTQAAAPQAPKPVDVNPAAAPVEAPKEIRLETGLERGVQNAVSGVEVGVRGGVPGGILGGPEPAPPPPPPPPPAPVHVGGAIRSPQQLKKVNPAYPSIAQLTRVQGVVILEAVIGVDGRVQDVKILRSIPLLDAAAVEAVKQWIYTPTTLNSVAIPVIMTVTVNFTLQ